MTSDDLDIFEIDSQPIPTLWPGVWEQMVSQLRSLVQPHEVGPVSDASRLHPGRTALHVAVTEPTTLLVDDPRPRSPASTRIRMLCHAHSHQSRMRRSTPAAGTLPSRQLGLLRTPSQAGQRLALLLLTRNILCQHRAGATESQAAQILPELILLILKLPADVNHFSGLLRPAQPPDWSRR